MFEVKVSCRGLELSVVSEQFPFEVAGKLIERLAEETGCHVF